MAMDIDTKVLVLHVKNGYEEREKHIQRMMAAEGIAFDFILDGDKNELSDEILDRYFTGEMKQVTSATSCAMKHLLACRHIVEHDLPGALVLEDDMILYRNFKPVFAACMKEIEQRRIDSPLISFEDSALKFVPGSQRKRGQHLYPATSDRFAGCLFYSRGCAEQILDYVERQKCDLPIDLLHKALITRIGLSYYWCHPAIATQGTHNGLFASSINEQSARKQRYRALTWKIKLAYKKFLYRLR